MKGEREESGVPLDGRLTTKPDDGADSGKGDTGQAERDEQIAIVAR